MNTIDAWEQGYDRGYEDGAAVAFGIIGMGYAIKGRCFDDFISELKDISKRARDE